jgi:hypothetical protein
MPGPRVLVVAETPSLARSLSYLLESAGIPTDTVPTLDVPTLEGEESWATTTEPAGHSLIIAASNGPYCATARRWVQGGFPGTELIVVGSRDPTLTRASRIRQVELPLRPGDLLELVRARLYPIAPPHPNST